MVADVATLEPQQAEKMAHETTLVWIRPPGRNHNQRAITAYMRSPMPERFISSPMRMNSGIATRIKPVVPSQALLAMMFQSGASEKKYMMIRDRHPRAAATYMPAMKNAPINPNATPRTTA